MSNLPGKQMPATPTQDHLPIKTTTDHIASALWHLNKAQDAAANDYKYKTYQPFRASIESNYNKLLVLLQVLQHDKHKHPKP